MEHIESGHRPAKRKEPKTKPDPKIKTVGITEEAFVQVEASANKLKMSKTRYASAAITYFAESGLDPTKEPRLGFAGVNIKVEEIERNIRAQNFEIGTRLIQIIRSWEKNSYAFMQQQQAAMTNYLELIESNILQHQVLVETKLLAPMVEQLFKVNMEANITRNLLTRAYVGDRRLCDESKQPAERFVEKTKGFDNERIQRLKARMSKFIESNTVPLPMPTRRPAVTPVPAPQPKPAAPAPAAPAGPAKS